MSVKQLEVRLISLLKRRKGSIQAQNVLECHLALLLKLKTTGSSLAIIKRLLDKMSTEGKIVIGWNGNVRRSVTLVTQDAKPVISDVVESEKEEVHVQEVMVSEMATVDAVPAVEPDVVVAKAGNMPKHELLTIVLLECRQIGGDAGRINGPIVRHLQDSLGYSKKATEAWVKALRNMGLLECITAGSKPVYRIDTKVDAVTEEMLAALPALTTKRRNSSTEKQSKSVPSKPKAKADLPPAEISAEAATPETPLTGRIEALLGAALTEIKRLRSLEDQYRNGLKELEDLRTENGKLKANLESLGRIGDDLEAMLQLDLVH